LIIDHVPSKIDSRTYSFAMYKKQEKMHSYTGC